jgi:hypothetical protein
MLTGGGTVANEDLICHMTDYTQLITTYIRYSQVVAIIFPCTHVTLLRLPLLSSGQSSWQQNGDVL